MPMRESLTTLRTHLSELYQTNPDIQRVTGDAGLNLAHINFNQSPINLWRNILVQAYLHGRVEMIVNIAIEDYPTWAEKLQHAYQIYLRSDKAAEEKDNQQKEKIQHQEVDFYKFKASLASILAISSDEIGLLQRITNGWRIEMPPDAADRFLLLKEQNASQFHSLRIRSVEIINRQTSLPSLFSGTCVTKDVHTFRLALNGKVIEEMANNLELLINNTSSIDYKQVRIHLQPSHHVISLDPTDFRLADLKQNSTRSLPIKLHASQPGSYEIQVRASSIPAPSDGFLRTTLQLVVEPTPPQCILKIELL